jgi:FlaA1/EpsC-like NDP-sugar epimerase
MEGTKMMDKISLEKVLGRNEISELVDIASQLQGLNERVLVTGANGSIGTVLTEKLRHHNVNFLSTDIEGDHVKMDITDPVVVKKVLDEYKPTIIVNIAGAKHAPVGEHETWMTLSINTLGTKNLLDYKPNGCRLILTSTCKSANPEIVYGASKLIAERMTMNSGGSVVRFFNVVETQGNVFEIWRNVPETEPIKVAPTCERHFISVGESVGLIIFAMLRQEPGRFIVNSGHLRLMEDVANDLYPDREKQIIAPRRGDRLTERFMATSERIKKYHLNDGLIELGSIHDL